MSNKVDTTLATLAFISDFLAKSTLRYYPPKNQTLTKKCEIAISHIKFMKNELHSINHPSIMYNQISPDLSLSAI